ncbi:pyridoxamine 5'-phosphate oxidase family protein [Nocardiopsis sp. CNT312]|uniref:pyridoxamine 5'-phosphate oxidase family protein n=1 Tax=Nocardiopsis sp. CNT312 TaxID=1137268 RepID=UPI00048AEFB1|nr:pyridoxamine 5'-phosphate oxidase family protein [Nocardiopsis sp. CNT312]
MHQSPRVEPLTDAEPGSWDRVLPLLEAEPGTSWLTVTGKDGPPHTRPLLVVWASGRPCFASGEDTAKARLLSVSPQASLAFQAAGLDVVVEGTVQRVKEHGRVRRVADAYAKAYGWAPQAEGALLTGAEGAPTAGPPPYAVYTVVPTTVYAFPSDEAPCGPTRWRFDP